MKRLIWLFLAGVLVTAGAVAAAPGRGTTLLVIPARYSIVQFSFDVARMRPTQLVAYSQTPGGTELHAWNADSRRWVVVTAHDLAAGRVISPPPDRTVVLGAAAQVPAEVEVAVAGLPNRSRIPSLLLMDVVNGLNRELRFSGQEWEWLARRYNLELQDRNAERRRWGRFGPPGGEPRQAPAAVPVPESVPMPGIADEPEAPSAMRVAPAPEAVAPAPEPAAFRSRTVAPARQRLVIDVTTGEPEKGVPDVAKRRAAKAEATMPEQEPMQEPELVEEGFLLEPDLSDEPMVDAVPDLSPEDK